MISTTFIFGLVLLWVGAVALGSLVVLRGRWQAAAAHGRLDLLPSLAMRKGLEAVCLFAGSGGMILGLGLIAVGVMR